METINLSIWISDIQNNFCCLKLPQTDLNIFGNSVATTQQILLIVREPT
jgi:hypothetical protein